MDLFSKRTKTDIENTFSQKAAVLEAVAAFKDQIRKMSIHDDQFITATGMSRKKFFDYLENEDPRKITLWELASYADAFGFRFRISCG